MTQHTFTKLLFSVANLMYTFVGATLLSIGMWIAYESKSFIELTHFGLKFVEDEEFEIDGIVVGYIERLTNETALEDGLIIILSIGNFVFQCVEKYILSVKCYKTF